MSAKARGTLREQRSTTARPAATAALHNHVGRRQPPLPVPTMTLSISVQFASQAKHLPSRAQVRRWALAAHRGGAASLSDADALVTIRYVDEKEGRALNLQFRGKDYATNVLTFVHEVAPVGNPIAYAADIVICAPVIAREAREQKKPVAAHHGHMVLHGLLHAQGFDHEDSVEAEAMEAIEIALLRRFRIANPYATA